MGKWAIVLGCAVSGIFCNRASASITFSDDFSGGLNPLVWKTEKTAPSYTIDATHGDVRMSSPANAGTSYRAARVYFTPKVLGDFDMQVDFHDANLALINHLPAAANQIALHAQFGGQHFATTRDIATVEGNNYHVYLNPPGATYGVIPTTDLAGTFHVIRQGDVYSGWFNSTKIFDRTFSGAPDPSALWFSLENNQTNDAISVTYDNFSITADQIVGLPPAAVPLPPGLLTGALTAGTLLVARRRRFKR
jgi:hypothetical protein